MKRPPYLDVEDEVSADTMIRNATRGLIVTALLCLLWVSGCTSMARRFSTPVTLVWYGLARQGTFEKPTYVPLSDSVTLATGEGIQLFLSVQPSAYLYVLYQKESGEFAVMWPKLELNFNAHLKSGYVQTLPARGHVYTMGRARGLEAIYLIASLKPVESVSALTREMRVLFASAQALATGVPKRRISESLPDEVTWKLDLSDRGQITLDDAYLKFGTSVKTIGRTSRGREQITTTAEGDTYALRPEYITGEDIVARIVRIRRIISR
jgi:hypothetical protein